MQSYNSLNDASEKYENLRGLQPGDTKIWYYRNIPKAHNLIRGVEWMEKNNVDLPTLDTLEETHVLLGQIKAVNPEQIFTLLQGGTWSPEGEANDMLVDNGSKHTSMSVGDIIELPDGKLLMVDIMGFYDLIGGKEIVTQKEPEEKKESYRKLAQDKPIPIPESVTNWRSKEWRDWAEQERFPFEKPWHKAEDMQHDGYTFEEAMESIKCVFLGMTEEDIKEVKEVFTEMTEEDEDENKKLTDPMILKSDGITIIVKGLSRLGPINITISGVSAELVNIVEKHLKYLEEDLDSDNAILMMNKADELLGPIVNKTVSQLDDKEARYIIYNTIMQDASYFGIEGNTIEMEVGY